MRIKLTGHERKARKSWEIISAASQDAIILINSNGHVEYWSGSAERMFGYTTDEVLHKNVHDVIVFHQSDRDLAFKGMKKFSEIGQGSILNTLREVDGKTKDGKVIPLELSINPIKLDGQWWAVGVIRNISERKKAEKQIKELAQFPLENANSIIRIDRHGILPVCESGFGLSSENLEIEGGRKGLRPPG